MPWVWTDDLAARLGDAVPDDGRLQSWRSRPVAVPLSDIPESTEDILALPLVVDLLEREG